jgi:hypothetical protein
MPPRRLRNPQAAQHNPRFRHNAPLLPGRAGLGLSVYPYTNGHEPDRQRKPPGRNRPRTWKWPACPYGHGARGPRTTAKLTPRTGTLGHSTVPAQCVNPLAANRESPGQRAAIAPTTEPVTSQVLQSATYPPDQPSLRSSATGKYVRGYRSCPGRRHELLAVLQFDTARICDHGTMRLADARSFELQGCPCREHSAGNKVRNRHPPPVKEVCGPGSRDTRRFGHR